MITTIIICCFCYRRRKQQFYGQPGGFGAPTVTPMGVTGQPVVGAYHSGAYGAPQMGPQPGQFGQAGQFGQIGQSGFGGQAGLGGQTGFGGQPQFR
jgi:hypothetical protein